MPRPPSLSQTAAGAGAHLSQEDDGRQQTLRSFEGIGPLETAERVACGRDGREWVSVESTARSVGATVLIHPILRIGPCAMTP